MAGMVRVASVTFRQDSDSCDKIADQWITFTVEDAGGGECLWARTERWAFARGDELTRLVNAVEMLRKNL